MLSGVGTPAAVFCLLSGTALAVASGLCFLLWDHKQQSHLMPTALLLVWPGFWCMPDGLLAIVCWLHGVKNGLGRKDSLSSLRAEVIFSLNSLSMHCWPLRYLQQPAPVLSPGAETWAWASASPLPLLQARHANRSLALTLCSEMTSVVNSLHLPSGFWLFCKYTCHSAGFQKLWKLSTNCGNSLPRIAGPHPEIFSFF